jgi:hypothetical protein
LINHILKMAAMVSKINPVYDLPDFAPSVRKTGTLKLLLDSSCFWRTDEEEAVVTAVARAVGAVAVDDLEAVPAADGKEGSAGLSAGAGVIAAVELCDDTTGAVEIDCTAGGGGDVIRGG